MVHYTKFTTSLNSRITYKNSKQAHLALRGFLVGLGSTLLLPELMVLLLAPFLVGLGEAGSEAPFPEEDEAEAFFTGLELLPFPGAAAAAALILII